MIKIKILITIVTISVILSGCSNWKYPATIMPTSSQNEVTPTCVVPTNSVFPSPSASASPTASRINQFFFGNLETAVAYNGKFSFSEEGISMEVSLHINFIQSLQNGSLYKIICDPVADVPSERLNLGYFYVEKDKIYSIDDPTMEKIKSVTETNLKKSGIIVCQSTAIPDPLNSNTEGFHHYVDVTGDIVEYHSYNNSVETGFYESFTWEKGIGLTSYNSGFGAGSEEINLELKK